MRAKLFLKNGIIILTAQMFTYLMDFLCRTVFIHTLSMEFVGIKGLFSNILSILALTELGVGTVLIYSMYKPIAQKEEQRLLALLGFYKKAYTLIACLVGGIGLMLTPFLSYLIKDCPDIRGLIGIDKHGLREFIAFEPSVKGSTIPGRYRMSNQNIHGLPTPDMVIITPDEYAAAAERIAALHHTHDGMLVHVLSPEKIYNEFSSGSPDVSAFRKLLKMWYDRSRQNPDGRQFGYCLLMGRPTYDQKMKNPETLKAGYPRTLVWQSPTGLTETTSYSTDDFIAMLEDETTDRAMSARLILVAVGRYTVTSAYEADIVATKLESYMTNPIYGQWRNNVMMIADDGDSAQHFIQTESAIRYMQRNPAGANYAYDKVYLDAFEQKQTGSGLTFPDAKQRMLMKWQKEGTAFISYIGHANPKEWTHEKLLTWSDINSMSNQYLPVLYAATCSFGKWDAEEVSGAEIMVSNPAGGAIAVITPSRTVYISQNANITNSVAAQLTKTDSLGKGQRLGDILRLGKNLASNDNNMLRYHLFGDPALRMPLPEYRVQIDSIAGMPIAESYADAPALKARSSVSISGRILDRLGNLVPFNGPVQFSLYDAEMTVETHGYGETGKDTIYQERPIKLAKGSTNASQGHWSASILMPSEITNNYSPAMLSLYAYDSDTQAEDGNKNRLREQDIHKIVTTFLNMDEANPKYARFVSNEEIKVTNEYNLNIPRYIDSSEPEDLQDINAHLNGGIPTVDVDSMEDYWNVYPNLKSALFQPLREGYYGSVVKKEQVVNTIISHEEFIQHAALVDKMYLKWKNEVAPVLMNLTNNQSPKMLIEQISEKLLHSFSGVPLLDKYDVYQVLMEYWEETMQDDIYAICYDGYETGREISYDYVTKKKKENGQTIEVKTDKVKGFEGKIIPKTLLASQYLGEEVKALEILREQLKKVTVSLAKMIEENSDEDGVFSQLDDWKKPTIIARTKAIREDLSAKEELNMLQEYMKLLDAETDYKKAIRQAEADLDTVLEKKYPQLTVKEIKHLLVEEKWFASIYNGIDAIYSAVSHRLSNRVTELVERYEYTLKECQDGVTEYEAKVKSHLERMGFVW